MGEWPAIFTQSKGLEMTQQEIDFDKPIPPCDPNVEPQDVPRLSRQSKKILERLMWGPATNSDLGLIAQRFGARIHDLRKAGYRIKKTPIGDGLVKYELE
jgi:hypothetical protein